MSDENQACEVPFVEQLRSIPRDYRAVRPIQWADDGRDTGHQLIPVGFMMHRAADEIERLRSSQPEVAHGWQNCSRCGAAILNEHPEPRCDHVWTVRTVGQAAEPGRCQKCGIEFDRSSPQSGISACKYHSLDETCAECDGVTDRSAPSCT